MLKTPPGVALPFEPVLTVERPMRMPLRYTCMVCSGTLTSTMSGPLGESCGFHQYSPGLSAPVGLPVGVPLVWKEGFSTACALVSRAAERAKIARNFMFLECVLVRFCREDASEARLRIRPKSH